MSNANKTVLIVENNLNEQFLIQFALTQANLDLGVQVVENGEEAVRYLKGKDSYANRQRYPLPKLILTDLQMPWISGLELLTWVKEQPELKHIPLVVMSASDEEKQINQVIELGASSYLVKNYPCDELVNTVKTLVPE